MRQLMIFITLKIRDRTCLKIEKTWFLLARRLAKKTAKELQAIAILSSQRPLSTTSFATLFLSKNIPR